uniref:NADH-ubiquinone oxidoreductase chain 6 n=1 Tax=Hippodamia variegata TaxID=703264 RepID=A0A6C0UDZ3_9CUCU|nr:NADH dehydrogenase subunit 6 [Hippodamia variegata]QIB71482.1 NADH dehydrogenase subunit 6 [Hippodamia variegata]
MSFLMLTATLMVILKHPLSLGTNILIHTIFTCLVMGLLSMNFWFSYILILIMIGGLLVLFIYMTSVASNEKFKFNKSIFMMLIFFSMIIFTKLILESNLYEFNLIFNNELIQSIEETKIFNLNLSKFINYPNSNIFIMIMFYLLISMIAVVKISKSNFGPLRQLK